MKWTEIATAVSAIVGNVLSLAAIIISLKRKPPRHRK